MTVNRIPLGDWIGTKRRHYHINMCKFRTACHLLAIFDEKSFTLMDIGAQSHTCGNTLRLGISGLQTSVDVGELTCDRTMGESSGLEHGTV